MMGKKMLLKLMSNYLRENKHPKWACDIRSYEAVRKAILALDDLEDSLNAKWQEGRLRALCEVSLREKFDRQHSKLLAALQQDSVEEVLLQCKRMGAAWRALDASVPPQAASAASGVIEARLSDGTVLTIIQSAMQVLTLPPAASGVRLVLTAEQIAAAVERYPDELGVRAAMQRGSVGSALAANGLADPDAIDNSPYHDDPIPF